MLPVLASFSIDLTGMMSYAEDMFNGLFPALVPVVGIVLGLGILFMIYNAIKSAVKM